MNPTSFSPAQPYSITIAPPARLTVGPDGSYGVAKSSYYYEQSGQPPIFIQEKKETPLNNRLKKAFSPKELGVDAGIGAIWTLLWGAVEKGRTGAFAFKQNAYIIPLIMAAGVLIRGIFNIGTYRHSD